MKRSRIFLSVGVLACVLVALLIYVKMGIYAAILLGGLISIVILSSLFFVLKYYLPDRRLRKFLNEEIRYNCERKGRCCYLWVELDKNDYDRIMSHAKKNNMKEEIILKRGDRHWLVHKKGACVFLEAAEDGYTTCRIYDIRPTACRLYPMVPEGSKLRLDLECPCFSEKDGKSFQDYLQSQGVLGYVRRNWEEADRYIGKMGERFKR